MRAIVVGAGTVGSNIAAYLNRERQEVLVIDSNPQRLEDLENHLDVQTLLGNGCDPRTIKEAMGDSDTCMLLAMTEQDNTNLIIAYAARKLGCSRTVARVRHRFYLDNPKLNFRDPLGIDLLISPEILAAQELANFVENPAALAIATLAEGRVHLRTVMLSPFSELSSRKLKDIRLPMGVLVAVIRRGKKTFTPRGDDELTVGDHVTLIGLPEAIDEAHMLFDTEQQVGQRTGQKVAIAGAGETGLFLAEQLERRHHRVYLLEQDRARCLAADERLKNATVLHGDCTNIQFLREEQIDRMDYYIAVTGDDESNIMSALLARELKVPKTGCMIDRPDYGRVVEKVGIDVALSPRIVAANRVMALIKEGRIRSVSLIEDGAVEVTEYQALSKSPIVGKPLKDVTLPKGTLIGALVRGDEVLIPRGNDMINPADIVVTIAESNRSNELAKLMAEESGS